MEQIWETGEIIMIKLKNMLNEKKDFKGNLEMIAQMNKNKHDSTIARIEVADRLPQNQCHKFTTILQVRIKSKLSTLN